MPRIRHTDDDEPVWLIDRSPMLRNGWFNAFFLGGLLVVASAGLAIATTPWALTGLPPALLMVFAAVRLRDVHTPAEAARWLLLIGLGMVGSFALLMLTTR